MSKKEENVIFLSAQEITVHNQSAVQLRWDYDHFDGLPACRLPLYRMPTGLTTAFGSQGRRHEGG